MRLGLGLDRTLYGHAKSASGATPRANLEVRARDRANGRAIPGAREVA